MQNYKKYCEISRKQPQHMKTNFSLEKMGELSVQLVDKGLQSVPQQVALNLPKLKKVGGNSNNVKLPKLKKIEA